MCPIVPTFTCGLLRSNFSFAIGAPYLSLKSADLHFLPRSYDRQLFRPRRTPALHLGHDFFGHRTRRLFVPREVHGKRCAALGVRAHVSGVAEHFRQRHHRLDHLRPGAMLKAFDAAAPAAQVTDDGAHVLLRHNHFHRHYRLQQHRAGLARSFLERHRTGDLERHFVRIHIVIAAIVERGFHVHHFVAGENAAFHGLLDALIHGFNEFLGNHPADDFVEELVTFARLVGLQADLHVAVLATAARLADVFAFRLRGLANRLAIRYLRLANVGLYVELTHHAIDDDFQVKLAHTGDDRLAAVRIGIDLESGIFLRQLAESDAHFFLVALGLRLHGYRDHRRWKLDGLEHDRMLLVANRVAGGDIFQTDAGANIAGVDLGDVLTLVGVHLQQAADARQQA